MRRIAITNNVDLSEIILGCCNFGTAVSEENAFKLMDFYMENGGNTFDTARAYCGWIKGGEKASESTLGKWIKRNGNRQNIKIITKGGHPSFDGSQPYHRLSRDCIISDIELSLKLLGTDCVDLYFLHRDDESKPVGEIMETLNKLVSDGKTKAVGVSNWRLERIIAANEYAGENNTVKISASQIQWSYAYCTPETFNDKTLVCMNDNLLNSYKATGIPVLAYTSQAGGVFNMGYKWDLSDISEKHKKYYCNENIKRYKNLLALCEKKNMSTADAGLSFIVDNDISAAAIIGCSNLRQLTNSMLLSGKRLNISDISYLTFND